MNLRLAVVAAGLLACDSLRSPERGPPGPVSTPSPSAVPVPSYVQPAASVTLPGGRSAPASFAELAERADLAVVYVETERAIFGQGRRMVGEGLGSGFVFDPDGLILTNNHVVEDATRIDVVLGDETRLQAEVVGSDPPTDVAVLRVPTRGLAHLALGDSDAVRVGDWVLAIGNPFGLSHTVSAGILSAKGRTRHDVAGLDAAGYYDFLQTDASINPGNSGGPLIDTSGRVVGMNTAIKPQANGIGFAIPVDMIKELLPSLITHGEVRRSGLGVVVASVRPDDARRLGLGGTGGALVTRVQSGGPGDRAGLRPDDVIVGFGDDRAAGPQRLRWLASVAGVGSVVAVRVVREGRPVTLQVTLGELPKASSGAPGTER